MTAAALDVYGMGQCCVDVLGLSEHYPAADAKCELDEAHTDCGGPTATALVALSRWGSHCAFAGTVGDGPDGVTIRESFLHERVNVDDLQVRAGEESQYAFVHVQPGTAHRTIFWRPATGEALRVDELNLDRIRAARMLYLDGRPIETAIAAARIAREAGVPVFVDGGSLREGMLDLAGVSDVFVVSEAFSRDLSGDDPDATCDVLLARGAGMVGVTLGARGYLVSDGDTRIRGEAYPVDAIDTTGCGDIFHAGLAHGRLNDWPLRQALDFAAWAAAQASLAPGGRRGIPALADCPVTPDGST